RAACCFGRETRRSRKRKNDVYAEIHEFCRKRGKALKPVVCISLHERQVSARRVAAFGQGCLEFKKPTRLKGIRRARTQIADLQLLPRLLRSSGERCGKDNASQAAQERTSAYQSSDCQRHHLLRYRDRRRGFRTRPPALRIGPSGHAWRGTNSTPIRLGPHAGDCIDVVATPESECVTECEAFFR